MSLRELFKKAIGESDLFEFDEDCGDDHDKNEGCGCDKEKNETTFTGDVAGTSLPLGYDDEDDHKKLKK